MMPTIILACVILRAQLELTIAQRVVRWKTVFVDSWEIKLFPALPLTRACRVSPITQT